MTDDSAPLPIHETSLFTEDELRKALSFLGDQPGLFPSKAAQGATAQPSEPWQLSPDVLDLLTLVSHDCALRVARILRLPPEAAPSLRRSAAIRFGVDI
jgi:hypothetical protein